MNPFTAAARSFIAHWDRNYTRAANWLAKQSGLSVKTSEIIVRVSALLVCIAILGFIVWLQMPAFELIDKLMQPMPEGATIADVINRMLRVMMAFAFFIVIMVLYWLMYFFGVNMMPENVNQDQLYFTAMRNVSVLFVLSIVAIVYFIVVAWRNRK